MTSSFNRFCPTGFSFFFFFNDTATTEIYTLSLHDALPISRGEEREPRPEGSARGREREGAPRADAPRDAPLVRRRGDEPCDDERRRGEGCGDRKSTRLNSSHTVISYAVFCLKKKKKRQLRGNYRPRQNDNERHSQQ